MLTKQHHTLKKLELLENYIGTLTMKQSVNKIWLFKDYLQFRIIKNISHTLFYNFLYKDDYLNVQGKSCIDQKQFVLSECHKKYLFQY